MRGETLEILNGQLEADGTRLRVPEDHDTSELVEETAEAVAQAL